MQCEHLLTLGMAFGGGIDPFESRDDLIVPAGVFTKSKAPSAPMT